MAKLCLCSGCPLSSAEPGLLMLSWHSQGVLGLWGSVFNVRHQGWGRSGQTKRFDSDPLFKRPNSSGVIIAENEILNALLWSIFPFFTFLSLLKLAHLPLKFEYGGWNVTWLNSPACIFGRLCHLRRDFSSNSIPQRDRAAGSPPPCSSRVTNSTPGFILYHSQKGTKLAILALKQRLHTFATLPGGPERYAYYIL